MQSGHQHKALNKYLALKSKWSLILRSVKWEMRYNFVSIYANTINDFAELLFLKLCIKF